MPNWMILRAKHVNLLNDVYKRKVDIIPVALLLIISVLSIQIIRNKTFWFIRIIFDNLVFQKNSEDLNQVKTCRLEKPVTYIL